MDASVATLIGVVIASQGTIWGIMVHQTVRRRQNGKQYVDPNAEPKGLVKSKGGGLVCVYHSDLVEKLDEIKNGVDQLDKKVSAR